MLLVPLRLGPDDRTAHSGRSRCVPEPTCIQSCVAEPIHVPYAINPRCTDRVYVVPIPLASPERATWKDVQRFRSRRTRCRLAPCGKLLSRLVVVALRPLNLNPTLNLNLDCCNHPVLQITHCSEGE